jgi:hypothetical protein
VLLALFVGSVLYLSSLLPWVPSQTIEKLFGAAGTIASIVGLIALRKARTPNTPDGPRAKVSFATNRWTVAESHRLQVELVFHEQEPGMGERVLSAEGQPRAGGRLISGMFEHTCRVWNTGSQPLRNVVIVLQLDAVDRGTGLTAMRNQERIVSEEFDAALGGPRVTFHRQNDRNTEATLDLFNQSQRVDLRITTMIDGGGFLPLESKLHVAARAEGLPEPVECVWEFDETAPPRPVLPRPERRPGLLGAVGFKLHSAIRACSRFLDRLASKLAFRTR